ARSWKPRRQPRVNLTNAEPVLYSTSGALCCFCSCLVSPRPFQLCLNAESHWHNQDGLEEGEANSRPLARVSFSLSFTGIVLFLSFLKRAFEFVQQSSCPD